MKLSHIILGEAESQQASTWLHHTTTEPPALALREEGELFRSMIHCHHITNFRLQLLGMSTVQVLARMKKPHFQGTFQGAQKLLTLIGPFQTVFQIIHCRLGLREIWGPETWGCGVGQLDMGVPADRPSWYGEKTRSVREWARHKTIQK